jgi:16S rRNA (adenine1518-N6/adenine1519-N6)-dimethyltransferase
VEVGPGLGALTGRLLRSGAEVHAVELDGRLVARLVEKFQNEFPGKFFLLHGDAVTFPRADLAASDGGDFKIVANLPYAISTPWLAAVLEGPLPVSMTLLLQRETAERLWAPERSRQRSAMGLRLASAFEPRATMPVPPRCFLPPPRVESLLVHVRRRDRPFLFSPSACAILRHCFNYRRKQLKGTLSGLPDPLRHQAWEWFEGLCGRGTDPRARAEELPLADWQRLDDPGGA